MVEQKSRVMDEVAVGFVGSVMSSGVVGGSVFVFLVVISEFFCQVHVWSDADVFFAFVVDMVF